MAFDAFAAAGPSAPPSTGATSSAPPIPSTTVGQPTGDSHGSTPSPSNPSSRGQAGTTPAPTPAPTQSSTPSASAAAPAQPAATTPAENSPWAPEYKFKVMDQEHEIPENFRALVKDAETQKQVKEIFEKAYGLDHVKTRHTALQTKFQEVNTAHTQVMGSINELREHYQRGDFDTFFNRLQIPEEKILQWVINKAQYSQLPPEQRKVLDDKRAAEMHAVQLEKQNHTYQEQLQAQQTQAKQFGLQIALERPDVKQFVGSFDSQAGKPGTFIQEVIKHGEYVWYASQGKVDLTPEQAIQQVMARYGGFVQPSMPAPQALQAPTPAAPNPPTQVRPLPNLAGKGATSTVSSRPRVKSLDDLKKLAAEMGAR